MKKTTMMKKMIEYENKKLVRFTSSCVRIKEQTKPTVLQYLAVNEHLHMDQPELIEFVDVQDQPTFVEDLDLFLQTTCRVRLDSLNLATTWH